MKAGKPTFKWRLDDGEGSIGNLEEFRKFDPLLRADLLKDWIGDLNVEYEKALEEFHTKLSQSS